MQIRDAFIGAALFMFAAGVFVMFDNPANWLSPEVAGVGLWNLGGVFIVAALLVSKRKS